MPVYIGHSNLVTSEYRPQKATRTISERGQTDIEGVFKTDLVKSVRLSKYIATHFFSTKVA